MTDLKPIAGEYLVKPLVLKPGDRLHRIVARLHDTHIDDLTDAVIRSLEDQIDMNRITHADGKRFGR
jgi:hypothetical protein